MAYQQTQLVVTPDDFKNMFGKDLHAILAQSVNDSNFPNTFLSMVQDFLIDWCDEQGCRRVHFKDLLGMQLEYFKRAVLYQAYYVTKNGSLGLGLESGIDNERGRIISMADIKASEVPARVVTLLHKSGLFNLKLKNRPRFNRGYPGVLGSFTGEDY